MTTTNTRRRGGLGNLLATPADETHAPAETTPQAAPAAPPTPAPARATRLWSVRHDKNDMELARVEAATEKQAIAQAQEKTGKNGGYSLVELDVSTAEPIRSPGRAGTRPSGPANGQVLARRRTQRVARDKLTVQVPSSLLDGLTELVERDSTRRYDEVEDALRAHLLAKGIPLEED